MVGGKMALSMRVPLDVLVFVTRNGLALRMLKICWQFKRFGKDPYTRELLILSKAHCKKGHEVLKQLEKLGLIQRYSGKKCFKDGCIEVVFNSITPLGVKVLALLDGVEDDHGQG